MMGALGIALAAAPALAQPALNFDEPTIVVTGIGRMSVAPDQAVIRLGATIERSDARAAQRELDAIMREALRSIEALGIAAENLETAALTLMPVYADSAPRDDAERARRPAGPRIVAYRATNIVQATIDDLAMIGAVVDAGIMAGVNEIRNISFRLADEGPYRITALERAVEAARRKAVAAANALGVRLGEPLEVRERNEGRPFAAEFDVGFARAAAGPPIEPGELLIEAGVDVTFRLHVDPAGSNRGD
jgi:uncharacterized protein YggE